MSRLATVGPPGVRALSAKSLSLSPGVITTRSSWTFSTVLRLRPCMIWGTTTFVRCLSVPTTCAPFARGSLFLDGKFVYNFHAIFPFNCGLVRIDLMDVMLARPITFSRPDGNFQVRVKVRIDGDNVATIVNDDEANGDDENGDGAEFYGPVLRYHSGDTGVMIPGHDHAAVDIDDDDDTVATVAGGEEAIAVDDDADAVVMVAGGVDEAKSVGPLKWAGLSSRRSGRRMSEVF